MSEPILTKDVIADAIVMWVDTTTPLHSEIEELIQLLEESDPHQPLNSVCRVKHEENPKRIVVSRWVRSVR